MKSENYRRHSKLIAINYIMLLLLCSSCVTYLENDGDHWEAKLYPDSTFNYYSAGFGGKKEGTGIYKIKNDTLHLKFSDIPDSIKQHFEIIYKPKKENESRKVVINYNHQDSIVDTTACFLMYTDNYDLNFMDSYVLITNKDSILTFQVADSASFLGIREVLFLNHKRDLVYIRENEDLYLNINASYYTGHDIFNETKRFRIIKDFKTRWNQPYLIMPNNDTIIMKSLDR
ncbi:MAG: hypothetical protein Kapaf2KO_05760 [Candidatus Kapaibacteriales bacterium]